MVNGSSPTAHDTNDTTLLTSHKNIAFEEKSILVGRIFHPESYPVRANRGSLPLGRYLSALLTGN